MHTNGSQSSMSPGRTTLTRMLCGASKSTTRSSSCRWRLSSTAWCTHSFGPPSTAAFDEMLTIDPAGDQQDAVPGVAAWRGAEERPGEVDCPQSLEGFAAVLASRACRSCRQCPRLLTNTSRRPQRSSTSPNIASTAASSPDITLHSERVVADLLHQRDPRRRRWSRSSPRDAVAGLGGQSGERLTNGSARPGHEHHGAAAAARSLQPALRGLL